jgi:hypothetical protein
MIAILTKTTTNLPGTSSRPNRRSRQSYSSSRTRCRRDSRSESRVLRFYMVARSGSRTVSRSSTGINPIGLHSNFIEASYVFAPYVPLIITTTGNKW